MTESHKVPRNGKRTEPTAEAADKLPYTQGDIAENDQDAFRLESKGSRRLKELRAKGLTDREIYAILEVLKAQD